MKKNVIRASGVGQSVQYIKDLKLDYIVKKLIQEEKFDSQRAQESVRRYKNFLILAARHLNLPAVPTSDIDAAWHIHILHTQNYIRDCEKIFGKYLHHVPASGDVKEQRDLKSKYLKVARLYENEFNEPYALTIDISGFW